MTSRIPLSYLTFLPGQELPRCLHMEAYLPEEKSSSLLQVQHTLPKYLGSLANSTSFPFLLALKPSLLIEHPFKCSFYVIHYPMFLLVNIISRSQGHTTYTLTLFWNTAGSPTNLVLVIFISTNNERIGQYVYVCADFPGD